MSDIDALIARAMDALDGVTAGPWELDPWHHYSREDSDYYWDVDGPSGGWLAHIGEKPDAEFIAASRQLIPELVGQLQAVAGLLEATQEQLTQAVEDFCALRDALPRETVASLLRGDAR